MAPPWTERASWLDALSGAFTVGAGALPPGNSLWCERSVRTRLVAKARWGLLAILGTYALLAGGLSSLHAFGFFLGGSEVAWLAASVLGVATYNLILHANWFNVQGRVHVEPAQILLDLLSVTGFIHLSGGAASWFWPAYLVVTLEAAFLLPRRRDVWAVGAAGAILHGLLLVAHFHGFLPSPALPFGSDALKGNGAYLCLSWSWVAVLNLAVAGITAYLVSVVRWDHQALRDREAQLQQFVDGASDLILRLTPEGRFHFVNPLWMKVMGQDLAGLGATTFFDLMESDHRARVQETLVRALAEGRGRGFEAELLARDGHRVSVEGHFSPGLQEGLPPMVWCICRDVSARKQAEEQLLRMARFDGLTGLPNRSTLMERLEEGRRAALASQRSLAVLSIDLDRFKLINDALGHTVGDDLLRAVGRRLQGAVRDSDLACRAGGDEFIVALTDLQGPKEVANLAARLQKPLAQPFQIGPHELFVTASIGISVFPGDGEDLETLLRQADLALCQAKATGRNRYQFYDAAMNVDADRRQVLSNSLHRALEAREFRVHYQPKVNLATGRVAGLEALVRWEHPTLGLLAPGEFIPLAEQAGLILPLGEWVLREACRQAVAWQFQGLLPLRMGVNLSGYQLQHAGMSMAIRRTLDETGLAPEFLELEITETVVMQNPALAMAVLQDLRSLGVQVSIDDFGTGHSSLAQLKRLPVDTLKLDKSFIRDLEHSPTDAAIATAILAMGSCLHLDVVAEGVETQGQLAFLRAKGCRGAQGYFFSGPVPAEAVPGLVRSLERGERVPQGHGVMA